MVSANFRITYSMKKCRSGAKYNKAYLGVTHYIG